MSRHRTVSRIVFTGADVSGKTAALQVFAQEPEFSGKVLVVPEAASILIGELGATPPFEGERGHKFQQAVAGKTEILERAAERCAQRRRIEILLCDRGLADGLAYLDGDRRLFEDLVGVSHIETLWRYHAVLFFHPPGEEAFDRFKRGNPGRVNRTYQEVMRLHYATYDAWRGHNRLFEVFSADAWVDKLNMARRHLRHILRTLP